MEYLDRAETLKEFLIENEKNQKEAIGPIGASKKYEFFSKISHHVSSIDICVFTIENQAAQLQRMMIQI